MWARGEGTSLRSPPASYTQVIFFTDASYYVIPAIIECSSSLLLPTPTSTTTLSRTDILSPSTTPVTVPTEPVNNGPVTTGGPINSPTTHQPVTTDLQIITDQPIVVSSEGSSTTGLVNSNTIAPVVGVVVGLMVLILLIVIITIIMFFLRRKFKVAKKVSTTIPYSTSDYESLQSCKYVISVSILPEMSFQ